METRVFREAQQGMPVIDGIVTDESDSMDTVATEETAGTAEVATGASEDEDRDAESEPSAKPHRRTRQRRASPWTTTCTTYWAPWQRQTAPTAARLSNS